MMTCTEVRPLLSFLLEKETGPLETLEARRHLDGCAPCRRRVERISTVMVACASLPEQTPPADMSGLVMQKLRALKKASARASSTSGWAPPAAKWSGLALLFGAALGVFTRPAAPALKTLGAQLAFFAGLLAGTDPPGGAADVAGRAVGVALRIASFAIRPELTSGSSPDLVVASRLVATALTLGFMLAIPVALLTAWFLHTGSGRDRFPRL
jgi:putative zinc finger protein